MAEPQYLTLIDLSEGPCGICASHVRGHCNDCGEEIPAYENMGGNGYRSPMPTHKHLTQLGSQAAKECAYGELCLECYRKAWASAYPEIPCQV